MEEGSEREVKKEEEINPLIVQVGAERVLGIYGQVLGHLSDLK